MENTLSIIRNSAKIATLDTNRMEAALLYAKNDIDTFFFRLAVIADKHYDTSIQNKAWKFLNKQDKLKNILTDLITRLQFLKNDYSSSRSKQLQALTQMNTEISIFNEIHFTVKRAYIGFTAEHFQEGLGQSFMVA